MTESENLSRRISGLGDLTDHMGGKMYIIIRRPFAYLEQELRRTFGQKDNVEVIIDRRSEERGQPAADSHNGLHQDENRRMKSEMLEVVLSI